MGEANEEIDELTEDEYFELYNMLLFMKADSLEETNPGLKETIELAIQCLETAYDIHPDYGVEDSDEDEYQDEDEDQDVNEEQAEYEDEFEDEEESSSEYEEQNIPDLIARRSSAPDLVYQEPELPPGYDWYREVGRSSSDMSLRPKSSRFPEDADIEKSHETNSGGTSYFHELSTPRVSDITDVANDPELCNIRGNELSNGQKYKEALAYYTKAMELNPEEPLYVYNRALAYIGMEIYILCVKDCKAVIQKDSNHSKAYITLSEAYLQMGDFRKAERECKKAINLEPNNDEYREKLWLIQGKLKEDFW